MEKCACCGEQFPEKKRGYRRTNVHARYRGGSSFAENIQHVYEVDLSPGKQAFVCDTCCSAISSVKVKEEQLLQTEARFRKIRRPHSYIGSKILSTPRKIKQLKRRKVIAKKRLLSPRRQPSSQEQEKITVTLPNTNIGHAIKNLSRGLYRRGLNKLFKCSKAANKCLGQVLDQIVRKEVNSILSSFKRSSTSFMKSLTEFSWEDVFTKLHSAPILAAVIRSSVTTTRNRDSATQTRKKRVISLKPVIGTIISIICFTKNKRCNLLQTFVSLLLWIAGCKQKVFRGLNTIGLCQSSNTTRKNVDILRKNYDSLVLEWKENLGNKHQHESMVFNEESVGDLQDIEDVWEDMEVSESVGDTEQSVTEESVTEDNSSSESDKNGETTDSSTAQERNTDNGGLSNATETDSNMSPPFSMLHLEQSSPSNQNLYYDITFDNVNKKIGVRHHVRGKKSTMLNMVQAFASLERVSGYGLSNDMPSPQKIRSIPISSFLPSAEDEIQMKAELEMIVSRILTSFIPAFQNLEVLESLPHDHSSEANEKSIIVPLGVLKKDETKTSDMVEILEEYSQYVAGDEMGKALPLLLFCDGLSCERVAGAQRARLNGEDDRARLDMFEPAIQEWHRRLMFIQDTFDELFKFSSHREKGSLYHLKQYFNHTSVTSNVMECFNKADEFLDFVTSGYVVLYAMHKCCMTHMEDTPDHFPHCDEEEQQAFRDSIACEIVKDIMKKPNTSEVVNVVLDKSLGKGGYCICKLDVGGPMIFCVNPDCQHGVWFHLECLGMEEDDVPEDDWYCSDQCRARKAQKKSKRKAVSLKFQDLQNEYVRYLMWRGLNNMARHDAVKENDGPRMICHWKYDMFEFSDKNHPKYFIYGHRLLANMAGATSERMRHNILWERTVNVTGGKRKNIPKDLHCEHLNKLFKQHCTSAAGSLTDETINRFGQMLGISPMLFKLFEDQVVGIYRPRRKAGKVDLSSDIKRMVRLLQPLDLFSFKQGRFFSGFEELRTSHGTRFPAVMKQKIKTHLENLAKMREIMVDG